LDAQFLLDVLAAHLDFARVPASGGKIVGKLHPQPRLLRTAECYGPQPFQIAFERVKAIPSDK
jgi:hypothetical protein